MTSADFEGLIKSLGETYEALLGQAIISGPLFEIYPGRDLLSFYLEAGMDLDFWRDTGTFDAFFVTLKKTMPSTMEYQGELPSPYFNKMTQSDVREIFGMPKQSKGPIRMPEPMGQTGGWESYYLDQDAYPGKKVIFQYTASMEVKTLVFTLIDSGRD
ncbi:DUF6392 family protein [Pseudomonas sp.]|jgi:hypothetical protein|uniref:DUF6392 family protein n=1 Tax=Pseudomonas sp. TaxID=306 RepID=UPI002E2FB120|nr:DUF6392 family protein [Pseudomonas sp.]HEX4552175.1 DUF6392 family protein [Pseudomonas sp.]